MRLILPLLSFLMIAVLLGGGALFAYGIKAYTEPGPLAEETTAVISPGTGVYQMAEQLAYAQIISDVYVFRAATRLSGRHKILKAGEYMFPAHVSMRDVIHKVARGDVVDRKITVREGLTSWQVVELLKAVPELAGEVATIPPEGSLLPETYHFTRGDTRQAKIEEMTKAMATALDELWHGRDLSIPVLSVREAVILASIVEKETGVPSERARIAGVFHNRLRKGMPLQSDPTVIYAITEGRIQDEGQGPLGRRLLRTDLDRASPYNTYKNPGLPPGPIANPGIDAIRAVLNPEKNDYFYFVADGTGGHVFARTLAEHNANVAKWRMIRREKEAAAD